MPSSVAHDRLILLFIIQLMVLSVGWTQQRQPISFRTYRASGTGPRPLRPRTPDDCSECRAAATVSQTSVAAAAVPYPQLKSTNFRALHQLEQQIKMLVQHHPNYRWLADLPYAGPATLGVILSVTGDVKRFLLPAHLASDPDFRKRFTREAQTVAKLQHPHIIRVFDYGEADGTHYMVMEYIAGPDLGHHLEQKGRLPLAEALPILKGIADALDYAHTQGLVHRDIKPPNILLDTVEAGLKPASTEYRPVLTDFGIAKILGGVTRYTQTGGVLGTFDYIAPEQIQGAADVDGRADVYALGVVAYHILTGALPFQQRNPGALLIAHMMQPPPDPREIAPDLSSDTAQAIQRAMAKKPEERFATAGEFINTLI